MSLWRITKRGCYFLGMALTGIVIYAHTLAGIHPHWLWTRKFSDEQRPVSHILQVGEQKLHYVDTGEHDKPVLLLVHGSPGQWSTFIDYFKDDRIRETFRVIAVDRPGFGYSGNGHPERSLIKQAEAIGAIFETVPEDTPVILAGHSFGGPVVTQMAMLYPERVSALALLAGSSDPDLQIVKFSQRFAKWPVIRWLVPPFAYSTNEEILALKAELERMKPSWEQITAPVAIVHGDADTLVPIGNAEFSERMLVNAKSVDVTRAMTMNHFVVWNEYETVVDNFFTLLEKVQTTTD